MNLYQVIGSVKEIIVWTRYYIIVVLFILRCESFLYLEDSGLGLFDHDFWSRIDLLWCLIFAAIWKLLFGLFLDFGNFLLKMVTRKLNHRLIKIVFKLHDLPVKVVARQLSNRLNVICMEILNWLKLFSFLGLVQSLPIKLLSPIDLFLLL